MKNKIGIPVLLCIILSPVILNAAPIVDFDSRNKEPESVTTLLKDTAIESVVTSAKEIIVPYRTGTGPRLMMEFGTRSDSGEGITMQPAQTDNSYTGEEPLELYVKLEILTKTGELVEVKPIKSAGGANRANFNQYSVRPNTRGRWTLSCSKHPWTAKKDYISYPSYGGHQHSNIPPPPVAISSISLSASTAPVHATPSPIIFPNLQGSATHYYWEQFPVFATGIIEHFSGCGSATNYISVQVSGLIELPGGENYYYAFNPWGSNAYHGDNHYGTQKLIDLVKIVADTYAVAFPAADRLYIFDMSLFQGGVIDVNRDWKKPFPGHDTGIDADISKKMVPLENRKKLLEIMCANADTYSEQDVPGEASYFHIRVLKTETGAPTEGFAGDSRTIVKCCTGNEINPGALKACISTQTLTR